MKTERYAVSLLIEVDGPPKQGKAVAEGFERLSGKLLLSSLDNLRVTMKTVTVEVVDAAGAELIAKVSLESSREEG